MTSNGAPGHLITAILYLEQEIEMKCGSLPGIEMRKRFDQIITLDERMKRKNILQQDEPHQILMPKHFQWKSKSTL